jgi:hypothetical protein
VIVSATAIFRQQRVDTTHVDGILYDDGKLLCVGYQHLVRKTHLRYRTFDIGPSGIVVTDPAPQASGLKECHANSAL